MEAGVQIDVINQLLAPETANELSPLCAMLAVMRRRLLAGDEEGALTAAIAAAPYTSAKLTASDVTHRQVVETRSDAELRAALVEIQRKRAEFAQLPAPTVTNGQDNIRQETAANEAVFP